MPAYNADSYIKEAVSSVLNQSYTNWELLIIDDGSTDSTAEILAEFKDSRISYYKLPFNLGVSSARNVGLQNLTGSYTTFLDADDIMPTNSLKARMQVFSENKETSIVDGKVVTYDSMMMNELAIWEPAYSGDPFNCLLKLSGSCFYGLTWMIKTDHILNIKFRENMTHAEDLLYFLEISKGRELQYSFTDQEVLYRRTGHQSAMSDLDGLESGYRELCRYLCGTLSIRKSQIEVFKRKAKLVMVRSYLSKRRFAKAATVLVSKW